MKKKQWIEKDLSPRLQAKIEKELKSIQEIFDHCFCRSETKELALDYFRGILSKTERKNSWQLAEQAGHKNPYGFQYLLGRALWEANDLKEAVQSYTVGYLGTQNSILSIDETGFLKKGDKSAGVGRQYSGTAGRIENCQIGVFLSYATPQGRALVDRALYIPEHWFKDKERCLEAGIPQSIVFKTKVALAKDMLARTFEQGVQADWVVGDEVYGCYALRHWLEARKQPYVLAVASNDTVYMGCRHYRARDLLEKVAQKKWKVLSCGAGSKGYRTYEWYFIDINGDTPEGWKCSLLFRRSLKVPEDVAFYRVFAPQQTSLQSIVEAAGSRWTIEECFEMAKGEVGLDHYEVRSWKGWYRHMTFSMLALSFLSKLRHELNKKHFPMIKKKSHRQPMRPFLQSRGLA